MLKALEATFWAVSDPDNARYGKHLNAAQVTELVGAEPSAIARVSTWLREQGASAVNVASHRDTITARMPCEVAERAFATTMTTFAHATSNKLTLHRATAAYSLPTEIAQHVSLVGDLISLPRVSTPIAVKAQPVEESVGAFPPEDTCGGKCGASFVTPAVLTKAYSLGDAPTNASGSIAVAEFQGVKYDEEDLTKFSDACGVDLKVIDVGSASSIKCAVPLVGTELCGEALLDIEYAGALSGASEFSWDFTSRLLMQSRQPACAVTQRSLF